MANVIANYALDYRNIDLSRLIRYQTDFAHYNNTYFSYNGKTYEDVTVFQFYDGGYFRSYFGGTGVVWATNYSQVLAGTVTGYIEEFWTGTSWKTSWGIESFSHSAVSFSNAAFTTSTIDDLSIVSQILNGNDTFYLSDYADVIRGYSGNDTIYAFGGNDIIYGDSGNDYIDGGLGTDVASYASSSDNYALQFGTNGFTLINSTNTAEADDLISVERLVFTNRTVILDSQAHASYTDIPDSLYQFFITAFGAAPGVSYMNQLAEAYRYGLSVKQIVNIFTTKSQFTDLYPTTLSVNERATQLVDRIVKTSATSSTKASAVSDIQWCLENGWTIGDVIYTVFGNLASKPATDSSWGGTAQQFANQVVVAKYYTDVLSQSTTDLETLRDVVDVVTASTVISSNAVVANLIGVALLSGGVI